MKYTLSDFRKKTREAFNAAENGEVVIIERHGVLFELTKQSNDEYSLEDFKSGKVKEDIKAMSGVNDVFKGALSNEAHGFRQHMTNEATLQGMTPEQISKMYPEPRVEPIDE